jgi:hypothetical protein
MSSSDTAGTARQKCPMTANELIRILARLTISPVPGGVELECGRCREAKVFTPRWESGVAFTDPVIWGRDHKCRAIRPVPVLEPGDVLARVF